MGRMEKKSTFDFDIDELIAHTGGAFKASALLNLRVRELVVYNGPKPTRPGVPSLIAQAIAEMQEGSIDLKLADADAVAEAERAKKRAVERRASRGVR